METATVETPIERSPGHLRKFLNSLTNKTLPITSSSTSSTTSYTVTTTTTYTETFHSQPTEIVGVSPPHHDASTNCKYFFMKY